MTTEQVPAKKNHTVGNVAGIGVVLALLGAFLIWRGSNIGSPSTVGFLLVLLAISFLLTALVYRFKRH